jgi:rare lipoprotein A
MEERLMPTKNSFGALALVVLICVLMPLVSIAKSTPADPSSGPMKGICVYYNDKFQGHILASGEKYDKDALTAAHKTLPFGTMVKVTNLSNNKSVVVRVNDRGPHGGSKSKIIEITSRAAKDIDMIKEGKVQVQIEIVELGKK